MKKILVLLFLIFSTIALFGCTNESSNTKDPSSTFKAGSYEMIGEEGKLGFIYDEQGPPFIPGEGNKYMWHFWGDVSEGDSLKVVGTNQDTGEEEVIIDDIVLGGAHNTADAHTPSSMSVPSEGIWELDAYINNNLFGTVVVETK
ncbi:hypothetical protein CEY16_13690 [Halalkalibacillus sediminis]|uniref:DUF4871 domain-containing protein n=1 Tax=Halalkalibacillus sediminis TaxID=2018042 RepID=A0A2I0QRA2_9BACI|nr:hypothetical protein [Halalkalibacillus sediminis]PKR76861.1 hypothetical protein CEY16_13690 [Halalkalibacillus sediminis]